MDSTTTILGAFTVRIGLRADNPAFPTYLVFREGLFIGRQFSMPSVSDCEWLQRNSLAYALSSKSSNESVRRRARAASGRASSFRSNQAKKTLETA